MPPPSAAAAPRPMRRVIELSPMHKNAGKWARRHIQTEAGPGAGPPKAWNKTQYRIQ